MKLNITVDCTPEEARTFLGLPDVSQINDLYISEMQKRMQANMEMLEPEALMKTWSGFGGQAAEQWQSMMSSMMDDKK